MKKFLLTLFLVSCLIVAKAQLITENPQIDQELDPNMLRVEKVEVNDNETVLYFVYTNQQHISPFHKYYITINPQVDIIAIGGRKTFKFLSADGIPVQPDVYYLKKKGEEVYFKLYFERLDPGIEVFDMFECKSFDLLTCFNFYGVHINNPLPVRRPPVTPKPPVAIDTKKNPPPPVVVKPKPVVTPPVVTKPKKDSVVVQKPPVIKPVVVPPQPKVTIRGKVFNLDTQQPIPAQVAIEILPDEKAIVKLNSDAKTGAYTYTFVPEKASYAYTAAAKGYLAAQDNFDFKNLTENQTIIKDIYLKPVEVGKVIRLENLYFAQGEAKLLTSSTAELNKLLKLMQDNPTMEILIEGHTDIIGNPDDNQKLSENRVQSVKNYLTQKGIADARIQTKAYGGTRPLITQGNDEERKVNRRVEFTVLKK